MISDDVYCRKTETRVTRKEALQRFIIQNIENGDEEEVSKPILKVDDGSCIYANLHQICSTTKTKNI